MTSRLNPANLPPVSETLLYPLYMRAMEAGRTDALVRDEAAGRMLARLDYDFSRFKGDELDQVTGMLRLRQFDRAARAFMAAHPGAPVVLLGCGLDTRFERVDDGVVPWFDLDLPEVMALRKELLGERPRVRMLSGSAFEPQWMDALAPYNAGPLLALAEGVFPYFYEADIRCLVLELRRRFAGAELVFDIGTPLMNRVHNLELRLRRLAARLHFGLDDDRALEAWAPGVRLLEAYYYFDDPEPRLDRYRFMRRMPFLGKAARILHYRLG